MVRTLAQSMCGSTHSRITGQGGDLAVMLLIFRTALVDLDDVTQSRRRVHFFLCFSDLKNEVFKCRKFGMCGCQGIPIPSQSPLLFIFDKSFLFLGVLFFAMYFSLHSYIIFYPMKSFVS